MKYIITTDDHALKVLAGVMVGVIMMTTAPQAFAQNIEPSGLPSRMDADPEDVEITDRRRAVYHLVKPGYFVTSYDNAEGLLGVDVPYTTAIKRDDPSDLRVIVFENTDLIDDLSRLTTRQLNRQLDRSEAIVCAEGRGRDIKLALDRLDPALAETGTTTGGDGVLVCIFEAPFGYTTELSIEAPSDDEEELFAAFRRIRDWYDRNQDDPDRSSPGTDEPEQAALDLLAPSYWWDRLFGARTATAQSSDPYKAIYLFEWSNDTEGSFEGSEEKVGTHKFTLTVFTLASDELERDWYRLDFQTFSEISNHEFTGDKFGDTSGTCGWWTESTNVSITITTDRGQWWDYMPDNTVNNTTTGFSIGGNVTTTQGGLNASYSQSYGESDVEITVSADSTAQSIDWTASLRGCDNYSDYPDYRDASDVAQKTYNLAPSLIAAVPTGSPLTFKTSGTNDWGFTARKDHIACGFACFSIKSTQYTTTYSKTGSHSCTDSSCS